MNRKKSVQRALCLSLTLLAAGPIVGCRSSTTASVPSYLIEGEYTCYSPPAERLAAVRARIPSGFITGFPADQMPVIQNRIALIPDRDINYLLDNFKAGILRGIAPSGGGIFGIAGVTSLTAGTSPGGRQGLVAVSIGTGPNQAGFALQHEIGHAVEIFAGDAAQKTPYKDFDAAIARMHAEVQNRRDIRSYAKSQPAETWAEAYSNFYCSPESNAFIQKNLPFTNEFLRTILAPPIWEASASDNPPPARDEGGSAAEPQDDARQNDQRDAADADGASTSSNSFSGFLDRIIELLGQRRSDDASGGDRSDSGVRDGDGSGSEQARQLGASREISLALTDAPGSSRATALMVSTAKEITRVSLCIGVADDCSQRKGAGAGGNYFAFDAFRAGVDRNFFSLETISASQEKVFEGEWHLSGFDEDGKLVASRSLKIETKAGLNP